PGTRPRTVSSYRIETLREAVCNAIAFQDYSLGGTVDIIERERESVTIRSRGSFGQASPESFAGGRASSCSRRNAFLRSAMQRSGIVPGKCSGIIGMYLSQIYRHFPLPVFSCDDNTVSVTFFGTRFGAVPKILDSYPKTDAGIIMDLDRIYRGVRIPEKRLRILIETGFADTSGGVLSVSHIDSPVRRGSDRDSVLEFLKEGPASRSEVAEFLSARSPKSLTREQLDTRATNILQTLRKEGKIVKISGNTKSAVYGLKSD
ncbi:MAG: hypothetical protein J5494_00605, partial [Candidatus Methanomethylophilaceae archaeon]|nr:hypothetical protein [Candidatus Methanomethylophilaceae archaeon]